MDATAFKEIAESGSKRFADSPLGQIRENIPLDKPIEYYDKPLGTLYENFIHCPQDNRKEGPENNGHWAGERGDSKWIPNPDFVPKTINPEGKTWGEILAKYGIDGIPFKDGEPDFSEISKGNVEIDGFSSDRTDNFDKADKKLAEEKGCSPEDVAKWRKENRYTWHECQDTKTMQKVPSEVHGNIPHEGGISVVKNKDTSNA